MSALQPSQPPIQIEEDFGFQLREWRLKRIAWLVSAAVLIAGILGLFGPGALGPAMAADPSTGLVVEFHRFIRLHSAAEFRFSVQPTAMADGRFTIWLDRPFIESISEIHFRPDPEQSAIADDRVEYRFHVAASGSIHQPASVRMQFKPAAFGTLHGRAGLNAGEAVQFKQFVYP